LCRPEKLITEIKSIQKYVDASISSTINLPEDVSVETVGQIYIDAWREGLKGITVYREGSREGILITDEYAKKAGVPDMDTITYKVTAEGGDKFYVMVSYKDKNIKEPYQVFVLNYRQGDQDAFIKISNSLIKMLRNKGVPEERIQKYVDRSNNSIVKLTRFISLSLKTGNLNGAIEILNEHAFVGTLALKLYEIFSKSVEAKNSMCKNPNCKSFNVRMEEGCSHCLDCGWSGCN
jgi:ribonucleoside-diphosphate reductase alpha chain